MLKRVLPIVPLAAALHFLLVPVASAQCPVCALGAVAGVGFARWLGVDDTISGLWVGGMMVALTAWTINWLNAKSIRFKGRIILTTLIYYGVFLYIPLYLWTDLLTHPLNVLWGANRFLLGTVVGSVAFLAANIWYGSIKRKNGGHAWFPLQKVVWPVGSILLLSVLFFFIARANPTL
ncbi:MAG: hypothetical protein AAB728_01125 [Patescibacteria group bacterium]